MSKIENKIIDELIKNNLKIETQKPVPINDYPWKTKFSKTPPKSDIYIVDYDLYIEVKGFMTIQAMSKLAYLSNQKFKYYIFQGTEYEWNPYIGTKLNENKKEFESKQKQLNQNIIHQIDELTEMDNTFLSKISEISYLRLQDFIQKKIDQYTKWNKKWF